MRKFPALGLAVTAALLPLVAHAQEAVPTAAEDALNSGDNAWVLISAALVLLMTMPGLTLFYGGLVRAKNFLSIMVQVGAIAAIASVLWVVAGYRMAFGDASNGWIGTGDMWMLNHTLDLLRGDTSVTERTFALFQMAFAAITPALMVGAWVDRARFGWVVAFCAIWGLVVYAPVAHWIWGDGWLAARIGTKDFAGGIVVHTTAGVSALIAAMLVGKRQGFPRTLMLPHSPSLTMAGAGLLWAGWFGFNGGSALTADDAASSAIIATHLGASTAALVWLLIERIKVGKPTSIGFATGAIAGAKYLVMPWVGEDFRGIAAVAAAILFFYMLAILAFRLIQVWAPVPCGSIAANSKGERRAFLYMLHYLLVFNPLIFNRAAMRCRVSQPTLSVAVMLPTTTPETIALRTETLAFTMPLVSTINVLERLSSPSTRPRTVRSSSPVSLPLMRIDSPMTVLSVAAGAAEPNSRVAAMVNSPILHVHIDVAFEAGTVGDENAGRANVTHHAAVALPRDEPRGEVQGEGARRGGDARGHLLSHPLHALRGDDGFGRRVPAVTAT